MQGSQDINSILFHVHSVIAREVVLDSSVVKESNF